MLTSTLLNISSLLFGILAWAIPFIASKRKRKHQGTYMIASFSACLIALCLQFFEINHRINMQNLVALMDTIGTLKWVRSEERRVGKSVGMGGRGIYEKQYR